MSAGSRRLIATRLPTAYCFLPTAYCLLPSALRPRGGGDDVRPVAHRLVAPQVAQAVLPDLRPARFQWRARVNEGAVAVRAEARPRGLARATALDHHAVVPALVEINLHLPGGQRRGLRRRLGADGRAAPAAGRRRRLDDAEVEAD